MASREQNAHGRQLFFAHCRLPMGKKKKTYSVNSVPPWWDVMKQMHKRCREICYE